MQAYQQTWQDLEADIKVVLSLSADPQPHPWLSPSCFGQYWQIVESDFVVFYDACSKSPIPYNLYHIYL